MFTGLIEEVGKVVRVVQGDELSQLWIESSLVTAEALGASIAVNGVCLTIAEQTDRAARFDLLNQTASVTMLGGCTAGDAVNLEPALAAGARIGGHFVSGHIDCTTHVVGRCKEAGDVVLEISLPAEGDGMVIERGSIALNGASLTVASRWKDSFSVHLIPHTLAKTNLDALQPDDVVNLEYDMIGKYVAHLHNIGAIPFRGEYRY